MRRISLWLVTLALLALPTLARAAQSTPTCGAAAFLSSLAKEPQGAGTYQPLTTEQHLFFGLTGLGQDSPLEVRYFVGGSPISPRSWTSRAHGCRRPTLAARSPSPPSTSRPSSKRSG